MSYKVINKNFYFVVMGGYLRGMFICGKSFIDFFVFFYCILINVIFWIYFEFLIKWSFYEKIFFYLVEVMKRFEDV